MERLTMTIEGMTCGHCVSAVTKSLEALNGVEVEQVGIGHASVAYDPTLISSDAISDAVADEGYTVASTENSGAR